MKVIGIILIIIGIAMTATGSLSFRQKKKIIDTDAIDISTHETKTVSWPRITGIIIVAGGITLLALSRKKAEGHG